MLWGSAWRWWWLMQCLRSWRVVWSWKTRGRSGSWTCAQRPSSSSSAACSAAGNIPWRSNHLKHQRQNTWITSEFKAKHLNYRRLQRKTPELPETSKKNTWITGDFKEKHLKHQIHLKLQTKITCHHQMDSVLIYATRRCTPFTST